MEDYGYFRGASLLRAELVTSFADNGSPNFANFAVHIRFDD
jgi:hypothetical protein